MKLIIIYILKKIILKVHEERINKFGTKKKQKQIINLNLINSSLNIKKFNSI